MTTSAFFTSGAMFLKLATIDNIDAGCEQCLCYTIAATVVTMRPINSQFHEQGSWTDSHEMGWVHFQNNVKDQNLSPILFFCLLTPYSSLLLSSLFSLLHNRLFVGLIFSLLKRVLQLGITKKKGHRMICRHAREEVENQPGRRFPRWTTDSERTALVSYRQAYESQDLQLYMVGSTTAGYGVVVLTPDEHEQVYFSK